MTAFVLNIPPIAKLTDEQFYQLCQANRDLRFERNSSGDLVIMSPTGGETSNRNGRLIQQLFNWSDRDGTGIAFDSSGGFKLLNNADRSPDAAWIPLEKWNALTAEERQKFLPLCPDFVIELRSPTDSLKTLQDKMQEYINNGTHLGWLINSQDKQVEVYRQNKEVEVLISPNSLSGENILSGFVLNLEVIW
jgi:Uma2 family endonuclease